MMGDCSSYSLRLERVNEAVLKGEILKYLDSPDPYDCRCSQCNAFYDQHPNLNRAAAIARHRKGRGD